MAPGIGRRLRVVLAATLLLLALIGTLDTLFFANADIDSSAVVDYLSDLSAWLEPLITEHFDRTSTAISGSSSASRDRRSAVFAVNREWQLRDRPRHSEMFRDAVWQALLQQLETQGAVIGSTDTESEPYRLSYTVPESVQGDVRLITSGQVRLTAGPDMMRSYRMRIELEEDRRLR